jgi:DNA-binding transcriptional LysR family regulator
MSWDDLRTALFLARGGSVRRTARALGVSHSTVLRRLAVLERSAGVRLFEPKLDGYELTPAGQDVFDTAEGLEDLVLALERRVTGRDLRLAGPVRVTLPDPFLPLLAPEIAKLGKAHPDIEVTLAVGTSYADLAHREADVAIRIANAPPLELVGNRVAVAGVAIYGAARYLAGRVTSNLEALDWVGWEEGSEMAFAQWMRANVPRARVGVRVTAGWALRDAVDAGAGVAILPCALGEIQPRWRRVRVVRDVAAPMWILTHKDLRATARVRAVRDFIAAAIARRRDVIEGTS